jgi:hypothetical protein
VEFSYDMDLLLSAMGTATGVTVRWGWSSRINVVGVLAHGRVVAADGKKANWWVLGDKIDGGQGLGDLALACHPKFSMLDPQL